MTAPPSSFPKNCDGADPGPFLYYYTADIPSVLSTLTFDTTNWKLGIKNTPQSSKITILAITTNTKQHYYYSIDLVSFEFSLFINWPL